MSCRRILIFNLLVDITQFLFITIKRIVEHVGHEDDGDSGDDSGAEVRDVDAATDSSYHGLEDHGESQDNQDHLFIHTCTDRESLHLLSI